MTIDIITFTDEQFAKLSEEQIREVQKAQVQKNELTIALEKEKQAEKRRLIDRGVFLSGIWSAYCDDLQAEYDRKVEQIRDGLLFYLRFTVRDDSVDAPYRVDYSLTMEERYYIVRDYYVQTYSDPNERLEAFDNDPIVMGYLGELYSPLYDYLLDFL